ncbi:hypothetical protein ET445_13190 [Agromyces protaetiae]|uniref:Uncharacterized protein n=1 Tax=Agromyces protaetiae TaxID=2509455 RepID=A0A4V0YHB6_9MICO|nr:permease prefix domain 1-containing protein [Agromyces protaetiae]QAY74141.1 hypothetical protein ET445_13190 [Agromyces protaetiae]
MTAEQIHRLLDEAFADIPYTPETQDLKEEIRANLIARADELESQGVPSAEAARRAVAELGDVRALVEFDAASGEAQQRSRADASGSPAQASSVLFARNRVRPNATFVVRTVIASIVAVGSLASASLSIVGVSLLHGLGAAGAPALWGAILLLVLAALAIGWIVGDALSQETTTNHPMPRGRAVGYGVASALAVLALGLGGIIALGLLPLWSVAIAAVPFVVGIVLFAYLGATQTNRHKAWMVELQRSQNAVPNRFDEDPATAARFGMYTAAIWVTAFVLFVVLGFSVGWVWSWLVFPAAFIVMFLTLARMLFAPPSSR